MNIYQDFTFNNTFINLKRIWWQARINNDKFSYRKKLRITTKTPYIRDINWKHITKKWSCSMELITTWGDSLSTQEWKHGEVHEVCWKLQKKQKLISVCVCVVLYPPDREILFLFLTDKQTESKFRQFAQGHMTGQWQSCDWSWSLSHNPSGFPRTAAQVAQCIHGLWLHVTATMTILWQVTKSVPCY